MKTIPLSEYAALRKITERSLRDRFDNGDDTAILEAKEAGLNDLADEFQTALDIDAENHKASQPDHFEAIGNCLNPTVDAMGEMRSDLERERNIYITMVEQRKERVRG